MIFVRKMKNVQGYFYRILFIGLYMLFSKSYGYALRGILFIALTQKEKKKVQADEIARELIIPKYFLSKIMKKLVKKGILNSAKGPSGGFSLNEKTLATPLLDLVLIIDGDARFFEDCVLRLKKCNASHPCPLHHKMEAYKQELYRLFTNICVGDLLTEDQPDFVKSISSI